MKIQQAGGGDVNEFMYEFEKRVLGQLVWLHRADAEYRDEVEKAI